MAMGDRIDRELVRPHPVAIRNRLGPRKAMGQALAAYLLEQKFRVVLDEGFDELFQLKNVADHWLRADEDIAYPSASIVEAPSMAYQAHNFTPTPLEETWGTYDWMVGYSGEPKRTVLWKEGGASIVLQVDFWTDLEPDRQAIEALLSSLFNPGEDQAGVTVEGPELYYSLPMRFTLLNTKNDDSRATATVNEWRLRCTVTGECDIVSLRIATALETPIVCTDVIDPNDPGEEDE